MFKVKIIIILLLIFCSVNISFTDINSVLKSRKQQLNKIHINIDNKKAEKDKLLKEEKKVRIELNKISNSIKKNEKELSYIKNKISKTEKELQIASKTYCRSDTQKNSYAQTINKQYDFYIKRKMVLYFDYPYEFKIRQLSLQENLKKYNVANNKCVIAKSDIDKCTKIKNKYENLKKQQQNLMNKNKQLQKDKSDLLKTAAGKRVKAEQDILELKNTENALRALVDKLIMASKQKDKTRSLRTKNINTRKNNLPWPVEGQVIINFGKNKHSTLNTNVISDAIKIKAKNNAMINSVERGVVIFAGEFRSYGKLIIIDHKGVFFSLYGQLDKILVKENQQVIKQQNIATVGSGENSVLYFAIRQYNVPENPLLWLKEKNRDK